VSTLDSQEPEVNATAASLLGFLYWRPMSGGDIVAAVEASVGHFWNVTRSQIYRELRALARTGLVHGGEVGPRRRLPYTITDEGRRAFLLWLQQEPGPDLIRSPLLMKFFFGVLLPEETLRRFVRVHRRRHAEDLAYYRRLLPQIAGSDPLPAHIVRFAIDFERAYLRWLKAIPWEVWSMPEHQHPLPPELRLPDPDPGGAPEPPPG
jgi:DNA-binding PadR family transcriptional regulator